MTWLACLSQGGDMDSGVLLGGKMNILQQKATSEIQVKQKRNAKNYCQ